MASGWEKATVPGQCSSCLPGTIPDSGACRREDAPCPHSRFSKGTRKSGCVIRAVSWTCQGSSLVYLGAVAAFQPVVFSWCVIKLPTFCSEALPRLGQLSPISGSRAGTIHEGSSQCPLCSSGTADWFFPGVPISGWVLPTWLSAAATGTGGTFQALTASLGCGHADQLPKNHRFEGFVLQPHCRTIILTETFWTCWRETRRGTRVRLKMFGGSMKD